MTIADPVTSWPLYDTSNDRRIGPRKWLPQKWQFHHRIICQSCGSFRCQSCANIYWQKQILLYVSKFGFLFVNVFSLLRTWISLCENPEMWQFYIFLLLSSFFHVGAYCPNWMVWCFLEVQWISTQEMVMPMLAATFLKKRFMCVRKFLYNFTFPPLRSLLSLFPSY